MGHVLLFCILLGVASAAMHSVRWMLRRTRELKSEEHECWHSPVEVDGRLFCVHCGVEI